MKLRYLAAASAVVLTVGAADAAVLDPYQLDLSASSIDVTKTCGFSCAFASLDASFGSDAGGIWTPTSEHEGARANNFIDWSASGLGGGTFDVAINLVFATPEPASGGTNGNGGFATILGTISGGFLTWDGPAEINFSDGSTIFAFMDNVLTGGLGGSTTSGASFKGEFAPSEVPLPAGLPLVLGGLAMLGWAGKKRKAA